MITPAAAKCAMTDIRRRRGDAAERLAADYLGARGLTILARNLRCRAGELDLVCLDGGVLVVVEVRWRAGAEFGGAAASVDRRKQGKLVRAAQYLLTQGEWRSHPLRFDVLAVQGQPGSHHAIHWIKDAFRAG